MPPKMHASPLNSLAFKHCETGGERRPTLKMRIAARGRRGTGVLALGVGAPVLAFQGNEDEGLLIRCNPDANAVPISGSIMFMPTQTAPGADYKQSGIRFECVRLLFRTSHRGSHRLCH